MTALQLTTTGPSATRAVAATLAGQLRPGDVVALSGDLGAGKTCFVQGAAAALGVTHPVTSPTFVLLNTYPGPVPVVHGDVYRLGTLRDVLDLGEEVFAPDVVTFVEWGDAIAQLLPGDHLEVVLEHAEPPPSDADADRGVGTSRPGAARDRSAADAPGTDAPGAGAPGAGAPGGEGGASGAEVGAPGGEVGAEDAAAADGEALVAAPRLVTLVGRGRHASLPGSVRDELDGLDGVELVGRSDTATDVGDR